MGSEIVFEGCSRVVVDKVREFVIFIVSLDCGVYVMYCWVFVFLGW